MSNVTVHAAKSTLSKLLARVEKGEEIVISRGTEPVAKLVPFAPVTTKRKFGSLKGKLLVPAEFFEPLPDEELGEWEK
jgi:prevent-host-death family protein